MIEPEKLASSEQANHGVTYSGRTSVTTMTTVHNSDVGHSVSPGATDDVLIVDWDGPDDPTHPRK